LWERPLAKEKDAPAKTRRLEALRSQPESFQQKIFPNVAVIATQFRFS